MRGQRTLFDNLLQPEARKLRKGRSKQLIDRRDELLMLRYYYHTEVKKLRFDEVLKIMSEEEFFIEAPTIVNRLTILCDRMKERFQEKPSIARIKELSGNFAVEVTPKEKERYENCMNN